MAKTPSTRFIVVDPATRVGSYQWRAWANANDFYLTPTFAPLTGIKISLHGPREGHSTWGYRMDEAREAIKQANAAGGVGNVPKGGVRFSGRRIKQGVDFVVRFRWTRGMFKKGSQSGPEYDTLKPEATGLIFAPPGDSVTDLDLFVCEGEPWWPNAAQAHADNATFGPLVNAKGNFLTGVVYGDMIRGPAPTEFRRLPPPMSKRDKMRALTSGVDSDGVLWVLEQWTSFKALEAEFPEAVRPLGT